MAEPQQNPILILILIIYKHETTNSKKSCTNPMYQILKPLDVTSLLKTNFIFAILSIHTIQTIKYHYHTFSLFNSKFKFQNFSNPSFPHTFSLIPTNITFYIIPNLFLFLPHFLSLFLFLTTLSRKPHYPSMKPFFLYLLSSFPINFGRLTQI